MRATLGENASSLISACLVLVLIGGVACYCYYSLPSAIDGGGLQYYGFYLRVPYDTIRYRTNVPRSLCSLFLLDPGSDRQTKLVDAPCNKRKQFNLGSVGGR